MSDAIVSAKEKRRLETKEYYATSKCRKLFAIRALIYLLIAFLFFLAVAWINKDSAIFPFILLPLIFLAIYLDSLTHIKERLVISPKHLEYFGVNYSVRAEWKRIAELSVEHELAGKQECIIADYSEVELLSRRTRYIPRRIVIPLSCFSDDWRNSELGHQIKQYAPHLFRNLNKKSSQSE